MINSLFFFNLIYTRFILLNNLSKTGTNQYHST